MGFFARFALACGAAGALLAALCALGVSLLRRRAAARRPLGRRLLAALLAGAAVGWGLVPPLVVAAVARFGVATRSDERGYAGPLVEADGRWVFQRRGGLLPPDRVRSGTIARRVDLVARDGVRLRAFLVPALERPARFDALLVHGLFRNAVELERPAEMLHRLGGDVLMLELRNHGGSERGVPGFGLREALDVEAGARFLARRPGAGRRPLLAFGVSHGAAAVALASPDLGRLHTLVLDSPFPDFARAFDHLASSPRVGMSSLHRYLALRLVSLACSIRWREIRPVDAIARLRAQRLLVVGAARDLRTPPEDVREVFEAAPLPPGRKELWIVEGTRHGHAFLDRPQEYRRRLEALVRAMCGG